MHSTQNLFIYKSFNAYFTKNEWTNEQYYWIFSDLKALIEWGLMAHLPSHHCRLLGTFSKVDPLKLSKNDKFI